MEPLVKTWTSLQQVASADLNQIQEDAFAMRPAAGTATNDWASIENGVQEVAFQSATAFANATVYTLDASIDWRDRVIRGDVLLPGAANTQPGGANDTNCNSGASSLYSFLLYTGTGATDAGAALVSNGNPPALGYFTDAGLANLWVFCDTGAGGGKLRIYNQTGAAVECPMFFIRTTRDLGKR